MSEGIDQTADVSSAVASTGPAPLETNLDGAPDVRAATQGNPKQKMVPQQALHAEKQKVKHLRRQIEEWGEFEKEYEQRMAVEARIVEAKAKLQKLKTAGVQ